MRGELIHKEKFKLKIRPFKGEGEEVRVMEMEKRYKFNDRESMIGDLETLEK